MDYPELRLDILEEFASYGVGVEFPPGFHLVRKDKTDRRDYHRVYNRTVRRARRVKREVHANAKLTMAQAEEVRAMYEMGSSQGQLAKRFDVSKRTIRRILKREAYR